MNLEKILHSAEAAATRKEFRTAAEFMNLAKSHVDLDIARRELARPQYNKSKAEIVGEKIKTFAAPVAIATGLAIAAKQNVINPIVNEHKMSKAFKEMPHKVPQLAEADPQKMRDYFDVVKTYSPKTAINPLVAGALVNKMMEFGGVDHKIIQDISSIQRNSETQPGIVHNTTEKVVGGLGNFPSDKMMLAGSYL